VLIKGDVVWVIHVIITSRQRTEEIRPSSASHQQFPTLGLAGLEA